MLLPCLHESFTSNHHKALPSRESLGYRNQSRNTHSPYQGSLEARSQQSYKTINAQGVLLDARSDGIGVNCLTLHHVLLAAHHPVLGDGDVGEGFDGAAGATVVAVGVARAADVLSLAGVVAVLA